MRLRRLAPCALLAAALGLSACGSTPPAQINDVCAVFSQRSGLFTDWYREARQAERRYGIPVPVLMATMRVESGFDGDARPPRKKILGVIPGARPSSAYGYSQALTGTWEEYRRATGAPMARRGDFGASIDFIGWYHAETVRRHGVSPWDAHSLYLGYHSGWTGYARGSWRDNPTALRAAGRTATFAQEYHAQLQACRL